MENTCYAARTLNDERAMSAFESVFKRYGKSVYKRVLDRTNNRGVAQEVVKEVFSDLYARMKKAPDADMTVLLIEAITDAHSMQVIRANNDISSVGAHIVREVKSECPTKETCRLNQTKTVKNPETGGICDDERTSCTAQAAPSAVCGIDLEEEMPKKKKHGFLTALAITLLSVIILCGVWVILGLLVSMNVLPHFDLGFEWFNQNVFRLFS